VILIHSAVLREGIDRVKKNGYRKKTGKKYTPLRVNAKIVPVDIVVYVPVDSFQTV
jgi:hypothetical protein